MVSRSACMTAFLLMMGLTGCSTFDCCHWWGRNTDGSSNLGKKPVPIQQGPIAGTYTNPGVANTTTPAQLMVQPGSVPMVTTSPPQTFSPAVEQNSPAITPPAPPLPVQNTPPGLSGTPGTTMQMDHRSNTYPSNSGTFPSSPAPATIISDLPENKPSIPSPLPPAPQVSGPTIPGQATRVESSPMPLLLAPQGTTAANPVVNMSGQPNIAMPDIAAPTIAKPLDFSIPKTTGTGKNVGLNPGTSPPPLPPPPSVPMLEGVDRK